MPAILKQCARNMGLIFCDSIPGPGGECSSRWLTASEALVCQGFPVHPEFSGRSSSSMLCSFNVPRSARNCARVRHQVGNAMFIPKIMVAHLHGLLSWKPHRLPDLVSNLALANRMKKKALQDQQEHAKAKAKAKSKQLRRLVIKSKPK